MQRGPIRIAVQLVPLFQRFVLLIFQVGHQLSPLRHQRGLHFAANGISCRLNLGQPGKPRTRMEFAFGQAGIVEMGRLAVPDAGLAQHVLSESANFPRLVCISSSFACSGGGGKPRLTLGQPRIAQRFTGAHCTRQARWQRAGRALRQCFGPSLSRARWFDLFKQPGTQGERDEIERSMG